ncbi:MAG TPA: DUF1003 domain-containing protein [Mycobacteriales bacterium]|nr:DUF1003 domain-containing protein [Mycobacteriales bacterium]
MVDRTERRLDQPRGARRSGPRYDADAFGRFAETIARFIGTARFLVLQTIVVIVWVVWNIVVPDRMRFDEYPFIFLTLALSLQAAYAAPLILLAQNRQDDRDRVNLEEDRQRAQQTKADIEYLARELAAVRIALGEVATRDFIRSQLDQRAEHNRSAEEDSERAS